MVESPNHAFIKMYSQLYNGMQLQRNEITGIKDYFTTEIQEKETMSKTLSKYFAVFNYVDKTLLALSVTGDSVYIASFATFIVAPAGLTIPSPNFVGFS